MLQDVNAFVTGASKGIGREIAITLAENGANVALAARSDGIYETSEKIGPNSLPVTVDVTDEESVTQGIEKAVTAFGGLDCLVNNAGIAGPTVPIEDVTTEQWERTMAVNLRGMFITTKHAARHLRNSDRGRIINISSISGKRPLRNRTPYAASKMAVIGLTRTLALEFSIDGVTVNAVCPGATRGPRIESVIAEQADDLEMGYEETKELLFTDDAMLGSLVVPKDVAEIVTYLASESAQSITGQDINIDGGTVWY